MFCTLSVKLLARSWKALDIGLMFQCTLQHYFISLLKHQVTVGLNQSIKCIYKALYLQSPSAVTMDYCTTDVVRKYVHT